MSYRERLWPPIWWWPVLLAWTSSLGLAIGNASGPATGFPVFVVTSTAAAWASWSVADRIEVDDAGLRAGRSFLATQYVGEVRALDREAAAPMRGAHGDARAHLILRGWVATAVVVDVADPADPHPYWYVSTRHPAELAAALRDIRPGDPAS